VLIQFFEQVQLSEKHHTIADNKLTKNAAISFPASLHVVVVRMYLASSFQHDELSIDALQTSKNLLRIPCDLSSKST
jgi:hypothetical protein